MKKALSVFLMLALVGSVFAAEPVADVNITEFKGNASVQWGVDLDTGKTGFKNDASVTLKLNLLNGGSKSTTGDGVWGELVIKTKGDTFAKATNTSALALPTMTVVVDKAQINFGPAYVGITSGDTQTGKLKMDAAVKSADSDNAVTLADVGPYGYTQGITAGYKHDMFNVAVDFRSYNPGKDVAAVVWTGAPVVFKGKSSPAYFATKADAQKFKDELDLVLSAGNQSTLLELGDIFGANQYTNAYAFAAEAEFTGVENLSIKGGVSYDFGDIVEKNGYSTLGYSTSVGYKVGLTDTLYLRPQLGFAGSSLFIKDTTLTKDASALKMDMVAGLLFGWGDIGVDAHPDVYFMDKDSYKKVSPGVGVVVTVPLVASASYTDVVTNTKHDINGYENGRSIIITPSFFSGEILPGLTAATYSDIVLNMGKSETNVGVLLESSAKYAIPVGAVTITPQAGIQFKNKKYNGTDSLMSKVGVDVAGLVSNTTFSVLYESGNLIAEPKSVIGTLNFKTKISF